MKILMLASYLPHPLFSGGHIRLYNIIRELSKRHEIVLICERRPYQTEHDIKAVRKFCKEVIAIPRKKQWSLTNILRTGFSFYPFLLVGHTNSLMRQAIVEKLKERFDLIHIETFYVMQNLPEVSIPTVLVEHNIEYLVYDRYRKRAPLSLQPFLAFDVAKLHFWETYFWRKATKLVAVSEAEKKQMGREDVEVVPNGVDTNVYKPATRSQQQEAKRILFIGDFTWIQNRDAVEWILTEIWPMITKNQELRTKNFLKLWIVGKNIPDSIKGLTDDPDIIFDENAAQDTTQIFRQADLLLAPIRVGGGTSFKILEAMASGVPVVTTLLGTQGLELLDKREVLIGESEEALADCVIDILQNKELYEKLANNARKLVEAKYDWRIIVKKLEEVYESVTHNTR